MHARRLGRLWEVRPGEGARTAFMFVNVLLLIAAYTTTKAVRDAVLLSKFGLTELSYLMIGIAVAAGFVVSLFTRHTAGVPRNRLILYTNGAIAVTLVAMAPALRAGSAWLPWVLYFWSGVFGLLIVAEFWLLANDLYHVREARRLFPLIGAGAILGGVVGGGLSGWLARPIGTSNLLYVVAGLLMAAAGASNLAWRRRPAELRVDVRPRAPRFAEGLALVRSNRYVRMIAFMVICMTVCMTFVQWQYKGIVKAHFGSRRDEMTAFFGTVAAILNAATFVVQILVTPRLLRRFGVRTGLRVLPAGFLIGGALLVLLAPFGGMPELFAGMIAVLLSDGFRFSVDKASVELLYLPVPRALKDQAKPFIDTVVDRVAGAVAGFLWLFLTWAFHVDDPRRLGWASLATAVVVVIWLIVIARARAGYIEAYRRLLTPTMVEPPPHPRARESVQLLAAALSANAPTRTRAVRAIARWARADPPLRLPATDIEPLLAREAGELGLLGRALAMVGGSPFAKERSRVLLPRVLEERFLGGLERIARLLMLVHPPRDIVAAHRALRSPSSSARAGALELLDNLIESESKYELLQALDEAALGAARTRLHRAVVLERVAALDPWLRACIEHTRAGGATDEMEAAPLQAAQGELGC